ncbi:MAG: hypothetical protein ABI443_07310 [Chthoniobacterales bacterium]
MELRFAILNPDGKDPLQLFPNGAGTPDDVGHPPINYHAYAACVNGGFFQTEKQIPDSVSLVVVLLRRDLKHSLRAIEALKKRGIRSLVSWKESGAHQVASILNDAGRMRLFFEVCATADGFLSSTQSLLPVYLSSGCRKGSFIPTPYPVSQKEWDFEKQQKEGIFLGTREFDVPSRNHLAALVAVCELAARYNTHVVSISPKVSRIEKELLKRFPNFRIHKGKLPYKDYLELMSRHRMVFQWDQSEVPGQVAGDAALCRIPCVGGNSAIERIIFPGLSSANLSREETLNVAARLFEDEAFYKDSCVKSLDLALQNISYEAVAHSLNALLAER